MLSGLPRTLRLGSPRAAEADLAAVTEVMTAVASASGVDEAAQRAVDAVRRAFGWAYASYWAVGEDRLLRFVLESGEVSEEFRAVTLTATFREGVGLSGRAWRARDLVFTRDIGQMTDCVRAPAAQRCGVRSGICFPITVRGEVVGTMDFFALQKLSLSPGRLDALRGVGRLVSAALERIAREEALRRTAAGLTDSARRLTGVSEAVGSSAHDGSRAAAQSLAASTTVAENLQLLRRSVTELDRGGQGIAQNAAEAADVAGTAVGVAEEARDLVAGFGEATGQMTRMIAGIRAVAEQTKLLALNATIEAQRAGAAGQGFAVVATEVKDLAREAAVATAQISSTIATIEQGAAAAMRAIDEIAGIIDVIDRNQTSIAAAVGQQTTTTGEIAGTVTETAGAADGIARDVAAVADASTRTSEMSQEVRAAAHELSLMAGELTLLLDEPGGVPPADGPTVVPLAAVGRV